MLTLYEREHGIKVEHVSAKITDLVAMLEKGEVQGVLCWETVAATTVRAVKGAHYLAPLPVIPGAESLEVKLVPEAEVPWQEIAFRTVSTTLRHYYADRKAGSFSFHSGEILPAR